MLMIAPTLSRLMQDQGAVAAVVICLNVVSAVVVMVLRVCHSAEVMLDRTSPPPSLPLLGNGCVVLVLFLVCDSAQTLLLTCGSLDACGCLFSLLVAALPRRLRFGLALAGLGPVALPLGLAFFASSCLLHSSFQLFLEDRDHVTWLFAFVEMDTVVDRNYITVRLFVFVVIITACGGQRLVWSCLCWALLACYALRDQLSVKDCECVTIPMFASVGFQALQGGP